MLALGLMLSAVPAFAADTTSTTGANTNKIEVKAKDKLTDVKTSVKAKVQKSSVKTVSAKNSCIASAKTARATAIKGANDTAKQARLDAKTARDTAVTAAKANTDKVAGTAAIKIANATYKQAIKDIATTQKASLKTAKSDYVTAIKACPKK